MSIMELGALGEFVGSIAVVATLLYLANQVSHARRELQFQAERDVNVQAFEAYAPIYEGRNAEIFWGGLNSPDSLTDADELVFDLLMRRLVGVLTESSKGSHRGMLSAETEAGLAEHFRSVILSTSGGHAWFEAHREDFRVEIEQFGLLD